MANQLSSRACCANAPAWPPREIGFIVWARCPDCTEETKMPKYAPAREDGLKPYVVAVSSWGRTTESIYYAAKANDAEYAAKGRMRYTYAKARRATPEDMERLSHA